jgi:hypothetical protein
MILDLMSIHFDSVFAVRQAINISKSPVLKNLEIFKTRPRRQTPEACHILEVGLEKCVINEFFGSQWEGMSKLCAKF